MIIFVLVADVTQKLLFNFCYILRCAHAVFSNESVVNLIIRGTTNILPDYQLLVYSNSGFNIENDHSILNTNLKSTEKNNQYHFHFNGEMPLKKGLYYLLTRKDHDIKLLHISRFIVK